jgi:hypothetical protein
VGVKICERLQALFDSAVINQPTGRLGEEENQKSQDCAWNDLNTEGDTPLLGVIIGETDVGTCTICCQ